MQKKLYIAMLALLRRSPLNPLKGKSSAPFVRKAFNLLIWLFLVSGATQAIEPVTISVSVTPPYTPFLNEYSSQGMNKLQLTMVVNDSRITNHPARLQLFIEKMGTGIVMQTSAYAAIPPIILNGNVTEVLNGADLTSYFYAQNNTFSGIDQSHYLQTGRVPDGHYRMGFRVVDAQRSEVILSNTAYSQPGWFVLNDPPQLNQPRNNSTYRVVEPQNVMLEWYPRHLGGMNSSFAVSYQVELFTVRVPNMNPNQVALSLQPDYTETVTQNRVHITPDKFLFEPGVKYAWRIKAISSCNDITLFQNKGYSEVYAFDYGTACPEPKNVAVAEFNASDATIEWDTDPLHSAFEMRLRKQGSDHEKWYTVESFIGKAEIKGALQPSTFYDYQVKAKCNTIASEYSPIKSFRTPLPATTKLECGKIDNLNVSNKTPKDILNEGEMLMYGKFPLRLTEVSGGGGTFSGKGKVRVPYFMNSQVNVEFTNIKVNELNEVYEGTIVSIFNPDSKFVVGDITDYFNEGDQIGNIIDGVDSAAITLNYPVVNITDIKVTSSGNMVTVLVDGEPTTATIENIGEGTTIQDSEGKLYAVDANGKVTEIGKTGNVGTEDKQNEGDGESSSGSSSSSGSINTASLDNEIVIAFENAGKWALDNYEDAYAGSKFAGEYQAIDGRYIPWKFIPIGKADKVKVKVTQGNIDLKKVKFVTPTGTEFYVKDETLTLIGARQRDGYEVFAVYNENDTTSRTLGRLKVASYPLITRHVTIVPMQTGNVSKDDIETALNDIYVKYGITWEVTIDEAFTDRSWDTDNNGLKSTGTEFYSMYTDEMRALNSAYTSQRGLDDKSVYIFYFADTDEESKLAGDMPLESRFGYIFSKNIDGGVYQTIAHELGHGAFQLKHTFSKKYNIPEKSTTNLMDYDGGEILKKYQWDVLFDPQNMVAKWAQDEKDGQKWDENEITEVIHTLKLGIQSGEDFTIPWYKGRDNLEGYCNFGKGHGLKIAIKLPENANSSNTLLQFKAPVKFNTRFNEDNPFFDTEDDDSYQTTIIDLGTFYIEQYTPGHKDAITNYLFDGQPVQDCSLLESISENYTLSTESKKKEYQKQIINNLDVVCYQDIPVDLRIDLIKNIVGRIHTPDEKERTVLNLLERINDENIDELLSALLKVEFDNKLLLTNIIHSLEDANLATQDIHGDHFTALMQVLTRLSLKSQKYTKEFAAQSFNENSLRRIIYVGKRPWIDLTVTEGERRYRSFEYNESSGKISFTPQFRFLESVTKVNTTDPLNNLPKTYTNYNYIWKDDPKGQVVIDDPFKLILVDDLSKVDAALQDAILSGEQSDVGGIVVPAIVLEYSRYKLRNQNIEQGVYVGLDILAIASGTITLSTAAKTLSWGRKTLIVMDVVNGAVNLSINTTDLSQDKDVQKFLAYYNMATAAINIKTLYDDAVKRINVTTTTGKSIDDIVKLVAESRRSALRTDLESSPKLLEAIRNNPKLVGAWSKMFKFEADVAIRRNNGALEALAKPKGSRPNPDTYLSHKYIEDHMSKFEEGIVRFTTNANIKKYKTLGGKEAFAMPKSEFDDLLVETGRDLAQIEKRLGLNSGDLTGDDAVIAWIKIEDLDDIKIPSGNEGGVIDEFWIPGGKTSGGISEVVTDLTDQTIPYTPL